ncbi:MAG TPA: hypothetical protein VKV32_09925 [Stellaceae bacterium]|nr:hypothetical protein [Stellaceae bacterium]
MRALMLLLPLLWLTARPALADEFVAGTEDVPLMPGLEPVPNSDVVFDKPEGRIVEARAAGATTRAKVEAFYAASLPPLGWKASGSDRWLRDAEQLRLDFAEQSGKLAVGFTLSPHK